VDRHFSLAQRHSGAVTKNALNLCYDPERDFLLRLRAEIEPRRRKESGIDGDA